MTGGTIRKSVQKVVTKRGVQITTCRVRGINPYTFMKDYLDGKIDAVPLPQDSMIPVLTTA